MYLYHISTLKFAFRIQREGFALFIGCVFCHLNVTSHVHASGLKNFHLVLAKC